MTDKTVGASARDVITAAVALMNGGMEDSVAPSSAYSDVILAALAEAGYVIVELDDLELAVEWMDQSDNPWIGSDLFAGTWAAATAAKYSLKDVIAEFYATRQPEGREGE